MVLNFFCWVYDRRLQLLKCRKFLSYLMTWIFYNQYKLYLLFFITEEDADKLSLGGPIGGAVAGVVILLVVIAVVVFIARTRYWLSFINLCTVKPDLVITTIKQYFVLFDLNLYFPSSAFHIICTGIAWPRVLCDHIWLFPWKVTKDRFDCMSKR
jgi:hypothetical protein